MNIWHVSLNYIRILESNPVQQLEFNYKFPITELDCENGHDIKVPTNTRECHNSLHQIYPESLLELLRVWDDE